MLYAFFGTDLINIRSAAQAFLRTYEEKGIAIERLGPENYQSGMLLEAAAGVSLFGDLRVVHIDMPSEEKAMFEQVFDALESLATSKTIFVLVEGPLLAPQKKQLTRYAEQVTDLIGVKKERFNAFSLTDALLKRDKKSLWILLQEARREGLSDEEIIGTLFWQIKTLRLVGKTHNADEAGLKPFVYSKAKQAFQKFTPEEVEQLSEGLMSLYHEGHSGTRELDIALEKWVLSL